MTELVRQARPGLTVESSTTSPLLQRCGGVRCPPGTCDHDGQEPTLQRHAAGRGPDVAPPVVHDVLRSPGQPLDEMTRTNMGRAFGRDFSQVRVHTDDRAATSARAVHAHAYTVGRNVVFGPGQYQPTTSTGRKLIAHELAHTVQQRDISSQVARLSTSKPGDAGEAEAERAAHAVSTNHPFSVAPSAGSMLARQSADSSELMEDREEQKEEDEEVQEDQEGSG